MTNEIIGLYSNPDFIIFAGALDSYVKLNYGKFAEQRTQVQKKSLNPKFDELFF